MSNRKIEILRKELNEKEDLLIKISYTKGGMSYLAGKNIDRGYYLYFTCMEGNTYAPFDSKNFKVFVKEAKRFSQKTLKELASEFKEKKEKLYKWYVNKNYKKIRSLEK